MKMDEVKKAKEK